MKYLEVPFNEKTISELNVGDIVSISGYLYCGRDAVLPKICNEINDGTWDKRGLDLKGGVIFHTAVSPAGVGPTSSNKLEIESCFSTLSAAGVKMHLGKGAIKPETVSILNECNSVLLSFPQ